MMHGIGLNSVIVQSTVASVLPSTVVQRINYRPFAVIVHFLLTLSYPVYSCISKSVDIYKIALSNLKNLNRYKAKTEVKMFRCCRAERHRAALAKRLFVQLIQHATAADTRK